MPLLFVLIFILFFIYCFEDDQAYLNRFNNLTFWGGQKEGAFIFPQRDGCVLLGKERFGEKEGKYSLIGGGVEEGETTKEGLKREIYEESRLLSEDATEGDLHKLIDPIIMVKPFPHCSVFIFNLKPSVKLDKINKQLMKAVKKCNGEYGAVCEMEKVTLVPIDNIAKMEDENETIKDKNGKDIKITEITFKTVKIIESVDSDSDSDSSSSSSSSSSS